MGVLREWRLIPRPAAGAEGEGDDGEKAAQRSVVANKRAFLVMMVAGVRRRCAVRLCAETEALAMEDLASGEEYGGMAAEDKKKEEIIDVKE